jgi:Holliday junction resolvasome RuvABC endonuclease subunit
LSNDIFKPPAVMSIDPGVELGWALWNTPHTPNVLPHPISTGICKANGRLPWLERITKTMSSFSEILNSMTSRYHIEKMYCEWPAYFDDVGGQVSAGSGALVKLAVAVGHIAQIAHERDVEFMPVKVADWKGQVSKEVVIRRIRRRLNVSESRFHTHEWDAVGIGLHALGYKLGE